MNTMLGFGHHWDPRARRLGANWGLLAAVLIAPLVASAFSGGASALLSPRMQSAQAASNAALLPAPPPGDWNLIFDDEFDGTALDTTRWVTGFPWCPSTYCTSTTTPDMVYLPESVSVSNGTLKLRANNTPVTAPDGKTYPYTSGIVTTSAFFEGAYADPSAYKLLFKYGYVEMRARLNTGLGLWPAFWMLNPQGKWPPEIDIVEEVGKDPYSVLQYYHYNGARRHISSGGRYTGPDFSADFHTFAVSWEPGAIRWYVDGVERRAAFTNADNIVAEEMYLILNLQVGGWSGTPDATTWTQPNYEIDYVRVWQRNNFLSFPVIEDSFVRQAEPAANFGGDPAVRASARYRGGQEVAYLKFNVAGLTYPVSSAKVRACVVEGSATKGGAIHTVEDSTWTEASINWSDRPPVIARVLSQVGAADLNSCVSFDVTSALNSDQPSGDYSFVIDMPSGGSVSYASGEWASPPESKGGIIGPQLEVTK